MSLSVHAYEKSSQCQRGQVGDCGAAKKEWRFWGGPWFPPTPDWVAHYSFSVVTDMPEEIESLEVLEKKSDGTLFSVSSVSLRSNDPMIKKVRVSIGFGQRDLYLRLQGSSKLVVKAHLKGGDFKLVNDFK